MLLQKLRPDAGKRMTVRLRIMLLMPMLMETECGLRTTKEKGRRLQNWILYLIYLPGSI